VKQQFQVIVDIIHPLFIVAIAFTYNSADRYYYIKSSGGKKE